MKVLLLNQFIINSFVRNRLNVTVEPLDRVGSIIDEIEAHPEWEDGTFRIENVDESSPWTIAIEATDDRKHKEFIMYVNNGNFSLYEPSINYFLPRATCGWINEWKQYGGTKSNWLHPCSITTLYKGIPY